MDQTEQFPDDLNTVDAKWAFAVARRPLLYAYARTLTRAREDAEDAVMDALAAVPDCRARTATGVYGFLRSVVYCSVQRQRRAANPPPAALAKLAGHERTLASDPAELVLQRLHTQALVQQTTRVLTPDELAAFHMLAEDEPITNVAATLDRTYRGTEGVIGRARKRLRKVFDGLRALPPVAAFAALRDLRRIGRTSRISAGAVPVLLLVVLAVPFRHGAPGLMAQSAPRLRLRVPPDDPLPAGRGSAPAVTAPISRGPTAAPAVAAPAPTGRREQDVHNRREVALPPIDAAPLTIVPSGAPSASAEHTTRDEPGRFHDDVLRFLVDTSDDDGRSARVPPTTP